MKRPNFFIVGAPKCGTTAIASWLSTHPDVYFSPKKEPHFFNTDGARTVRNRTEYEHLFDEADGYEAVGEGSTHYLYSNVAVPNILEYSPDARIIVCLRNPIEMLPALHGQRLWSGIEVVEDCEVAWRMQDQRRQGRAIPRMGRDDPERFQYGKYCQLGEQLERLYNHVNRERVLPIMLDDVRDNAAREYKRILDFLGIVHDGRDSFPVVNVAKPVRSIAFAVLSRNYIRAKQKLGIRLSSELGRRVKFLNAERKPWPELRPEFKRELDRFFQEDVRKLECLLDRDLAHWHVSIEDGG